MDPEWQQLLTVDGVGKQEKQKIVDKIHQEIQFLRSNNARHGLEKAIIEDLLNGEEISGHDSDYETPLTDKIDKKLKELNKIKDIATKVRNAYWDQDGTAATELVVEDLLDELDKLL